jgi:hypothetical protein
MPGSARRSGRPPHQCHSKDDQPQEYDGALPYSQAELARMNERFVERVERAFKNGSEHRQSAAMNGANASRAR